MSARGSEEDICYVLSEWEGPFEWSRWGPWLMSHTAESPSGPISRYSLHYCHSRQPGRRIVLSLQPSATCSVYETTHRQMNWMLCSLNEDRLKPEPRRALMQPSALVKLLLFPAVNIWHSSKLISLFMLIVVPLWAGFTHNYSPGINKRWNLSDYVNTFTWQHDMRLRQNKGRRFKTFILLQVSRCRIFITSSFSWVKNDIVLFHRCNMDEIWIPRKKSASSKVTLIYAVLILERLQKSSAES